jgi:thiol-disulfide isomerase/thioredoxin
MKKLVLKILFTLVGFIFIAWAIKWYKYKTYPPKMEFSNVALFTVDGNVKTSISHYKGNVLIISCFQTWCSACVAETPLLNELAAKINDEKFKILYVTDEGNHKLASFRKRLASENIVFLYAQQKLAKLGIHVYPTTFLLNKNGAVIKTTLEGYDWQKEETTIRKLLEN